MENLIKIWKNKNKIIEGIKNSIFKQEHIEEIAKEREAICDICPNLDLVGTSCIEPGAKKCCSLCGCTLKYKVRSLSSSCDDKRWDAVLSQDEEDTLNNSINSI